LGRLDIDGDGVVTAKEFRQSLAERFRRADLNGDGVLNRRELALMKRHHKLGPRRMQGKGMRMMMRKMMRRMMREGAMPEGGGRDMDR
ncbi:MAG TPA: hypothetical protein ENK13_05570, partial [Thermopetrobacter sp.]|nr:hypothetical protein [Thermopetrobacter sp.]